LDPHKLPDKLIKGSVSVWIADLSSWRGHISDLKTLLSPGEIKRLNRLKIEGKQVEFICSRGLLRMILSHYTGLEPKKIIIDTTPPGKPYLQGSGLEFSVSHSRDIFGFGFSSGSPIGLDIQEMYEISNPERIIENFFHPAEIDHLKSIADENRYREHFFAIWTAKEAYLKAIGDGIRESFTLLSILPETGSLQTFNLHLPDRDQNKREWTITSFSITQGYRAALAHNGEMPDINQIILNPGDLPF